MLFHFVILLFFPFHIEEISSRLCHVIKWQDIDKGQLLSIAHTVNTWHDICFVLYIYTRRLCWDLQSLTISACCSTWCSLYSANFLISLLRWLSASFTWLMSLIFSSSHFFLSVWYFASFSYFNETRNKTTGRDKRKKSSLKIQITVKGICFKKITEIQAQFYSSIFPSASITLSFVLLHRKKLTVFSTYYSDWHIFMEQKFFFF